MAGRCSVGHRIEVYEEEYPGCIVCRMEAGTAGPYRRDYDGHRLADDQHESQCPVSNFGPSETCDCARPPRVTP